MIILPIAVSAGIGLLSCYVLDKVIEKTDIEKTVADLTREFGDSVAYYAGKINEKAVQTHNDLKEKTSLIGETIKETAGQTVNAITDFASDAKDTIVNVTETVSSAVSSTYEKAKESTESFLASAYNGVGNLFSGAAALISGN